MKRKREPKFFPEADVKKLKKLLTEKEADLKKQHAEEVRQAFHELDLLLLYLILDLDIQSYIKEKYISRMKSAEAKARAFMVWGLARELADLGPSAPFLPMGEPRRKW